MIEVQLIGRLGNNLFQYAVCRTIAERLGCNFWVNPSNWGGFDLFRVPFGKRDGNIRSIYHEGDMGYDPQIEKVRDFTTLVGFFQSERYFDNDKARGWFKLFPEKDAKAEAIKQQYPIDKYCYLNIRGGDVKFVVVTDDPPYAKEYFPDYPVLSNSVNVDFRLMTGAKYLIIANSSLAWWAAWLNQGNTVVAPHGWLNVNINKWEFSPRDIKVERFIWV